MSQAPLLSIAIPVYNGEKSIVLTLDAIYSLSYELSNCEVVISDNCSSDKTAEIIANYQLLLPNVIRYFRNPVNLGYDQNIDILVQRSAGHYVWFMGCGEKIAQKALTDICAKLIQDQYDTVVVNFDVYSEVDEVIEPSLNYKITSDQETINRDDFSIPRYAPAVSANIINRKRWLSVLSNPLQESGWCHIERMLDIIGSPNFKKSLFISNKCFTLFRDSDGWWTKSDSYEFLLKHIAIIRSMNSRGFEMNLVKKLDNKLSKYALFAAVLQAKSNGLRLSADLFCKFKLMFGNKAFFWLAVLPALGTPRCVARTILNLKHWMD